MLFRSKMLRMWFVLVVIGVNIICGIDALKRLPPKAVTCGYNEVKVKCKTLCPPQTCAVSCPDFGCDPKSQACEPGCDCLPGHLRNSSGICVPKKQCPPRPRLPKCGDNEVATYCKVVCPPQLCESIYTSYLCQNNLTAINPGCNCISGYLKKNDSTPCIPSDECFCDVSSKCRPTCENPNPKNCPAVTPPKENQDGCKCKPGFILSEMYGTCIRIEECPADKGCNGDPNSIATACPWPCPSTCRSPDASTCGKKCKPVGCQCKSGFILNDSGKCINPDKCKGGNPCGVNGTFSDCAFRCPNQNCPEDDSGSVYACKPGRPCPSGCLCQQYYRRTKEDQCVLASDCPPVECTKPNQTWNPCVRDCSIERCSGLDPDIICVGDAANCEPKCACRRDFYKDDNDVCVPKSKCKVKCKVAQECRPTCAVPKPPNCDYIPPPENGTVDDSCQCQDGYILSEAGGKCIKITDCPTNITCNGDPNAVVKECPLPCPSTCDSPNASPCKRMCDPIGCECKSGYLLSSIDGKCILPDDCKGGNPCGKNARFVSCKYNCPTNYCPTDDSRVKPICEFSPFAPCYSGCACNLNHRLYSREKPVCIVSSDCRGNPCGKDARFINCKYNCPSDYCPVDDARVRPECESYPSYLCLPGCVCRLNYKFISREDRRCVVSSDCPPVNCTRPNEVWGRCPQECKSGYCDEVDLPKTDCNAVPINCSPDCICRDKYLKNPENDLCVSPQECRKINKKRTTTKNPEC